MPENFNYISYGNREYIEGNALRLSMSRGRMFEYTPSDIAKGIEELDAKSIAYIEELPAFLCSEIDRQESGLSMLIRYGKISNTKIRKREVETRFHTLIDFGEVFFESVEQAQEIFDTEKFQLYRTHWAVRNGNPYSILERLVTIHPQKNKEFDDLRKTEFKVIDSIPPLQRKNIVGEASNVETFLKILQELQRRKSAETFYRGHIDENFELTPSLLRKWTNGNWQFMPHEDRVCKELLIAHYDEFQDDKYCFDRLVRMQHYGLPTRLLDISSNPLVALFFACYCSPELRNITAEVIIFQISEDTIKYYDSDTVSCIANLSNLTYDQKSKINLSQDIEKFNESDTVKKLLHHIKSEKGFFEDRIAPDNLGSIVCVKAKRTNTRIKSQAGAFLLFGHEVTLPEFGQQDIEIARITIKNKQHILDQLDAININATSVYPSIDQTATHLRDRYRSPA